MLSPFLLVVRTLTFADLQLASPPFVDSKPIHHQKVQNLSFPTIYRFDTSRQTVQELQSIPGQQCYALQCFHPSCWLDLIQRRRSNSRSMRALRHEFQSSQELFISTAPRLVSQTTEELSDRQFGPRALRTHSILDPRALGSRELLGRTTCIGMVVIRSIVPY